MFKWMSCIVASLFVAIVLFGCSGARNSPLPTSSQPGARHSLSATPTSVCTQTTAADPSSGTYAVFLCYMAQNSQLTFPNLQAEPYPHPVGSSWYCEPTNWSVGPDRGSNAIPGLQATVTPATTGTGNGDCHRIDATTVTIATDSSLANNFGLSFYRTFGTYVLDVPPGAPSTCTNCEETGLWKLWPGLHIRDDNLNKYVENTQQTAIAGEAAIGDCLRA